jgi:hypothetical protein
MGTDHMTTYAKTHYPNSPLIATLPPAPIQPSKPKNTTIKPKKTEIKTPKVLPTSKVARKRSNVSSETKHQEVKQPILVDIEKIGEPFNCQYCLLEFTQKSSVDRHINNGSCKVLNPVQSKKQVLKHNKEQALLIQSMTANFNAVANRLVKDVKKTVKQVIKQETAKDAKRTVVKECLPQAIHLANTVNNYNIISST